MPEAPYQLYRAEHRRRRRWPYIVIAAVCVFAALVGWQLYAVPRVSAVTPGPDTYVKDASPTLILDVRGLSRLEDVAVMLDGKDVTSETTRDGDKLTLAADELSDGEHAVTFSARSSNVFRRDVRKDWRFTVDTSIPELELEDDIMEGRINTDPATFTGKTEPFATVTVVAGDVKAAGQADASGKYAISIDLPDGESEVVVTTADRAGNTRAKRLSVYVDAQPPELDVTELDKTLDKARLTVRVKATDQLGVPAVKLVLDGEERELSGPASKAKYSAKGLAEGKHVLVVSVEDKGGNVVKSKQTFTVDSTEHFGSATLWPGAKGKDVRTLQSKLINAGVYSGKKSGFYDAATEKAVRKLQAKYGLEVDGIVGGNVLNALSGQIVVDLSDLKLYLYRDGKLVKSYSVAAGSSAYPTPTGSYVVTSKIMNPTWYPPNSDWAKDSKPIPPGIANPLGTRWIGTSAPGVGIHGTPDDASIGTYASHGCIRMHIWEVEDVYERVVIGMPVIIRR
ncbi:MAG: murein L,D-transpeptidase [Actinobacteria bacterium]|nr:murein L,D-transpeptidase [Actinomycetota bacterium]